MAGVKAKADFSGELKVNARYINGSFTANGIDNYIDTGIIPNQDTILRLFGKFEDLGSNERMGSRNGLLDAEYRLDKVGDGIRVVWNGASGSFFTINNDIYEIEINDGELLIDSTSVSGTKGDLLGTPTNSIYLFAQNTGVATSLTNFTMYKVEIIHDDQTHTWLVDAINEQINYYINEVIQGQATIEGTILSSQFSTNSIYKVDKKFNAIEAYKIQPIATELYNVTDEDNVISLWVSEEILVANDSDQLFTTFDENGNIMKQGFYSKDMSGESCFDGILDFFDVHEGFVTTDGNFIADGEPYLVFAHD